MVFFPVCLILCVFEKLQAYADYMGFILTLNEGVKGRKLTCEYKVSEVSKGVTLCGLPVCLRDVLSTPWYLRIWDPWI